MDESGKVLVDIPQTDNATEKQEFWLAYRTPVSPAISIFEAHREDHFDVIISAGYFFKEHYAGQLVAVLSQQIIFDHLLKPESDSANRQMGLVCADGYFHDGTNVSRSFPEPVKVDPTNDNLLYIDPETISSDAVKAIIREPSLAVRIPVQKTPFSVVVFTPTSTLFGSTPPWHLSLIMGILTFIIIIGITTLWRLNTKNTILHTRLEETAKREQAVKKYQEDLERLVEERTRDLKAAQSRLVNKAMEAGRAQLSAMVLHNIGNAITPIGVFMSSIRENDLCQSLTYLSRCYGELKGHQDDLTAFVSRDTRGNEIFGFMEQLIDDLQNAYGENRRTQEKIADTVGYISEIITMQQAYAASEHEVKRSVDLNVLVQDAIRMQAGALDNRDIHVHKELEPNLSPLIIDKNRLMQVLVNVIKNGYEAIDQRNGQAYEKSMRFHTFADQECIGVSIIDTGVGVDPKNLSRLFDLGHSGKGSSGFGLYYCKMFVEANQGDMTIESDGPRCGAAVSIRFKKPTQADSSTAPGPGADAVQSHGEWP